MCFTPLKQTSILRNFKISGTKIKQPFKTVVSKIDLNQPRGTFPQSLPTRLSFPHNKTILLYKKCKPRRIIIKKTQFKIPSNLMTTSHASPGCFPAPMAYNKITQISQNKIIRASKSMILSTHNNLEMTLKIKNNKINHMQNLKINHQLTLITLDLKFTPSLI